MDKLSCVNSAIKSNKEIYQKLQNSQSQTNGEYILQAYDIDRVEYYNADSKDAKKAKRKKLHKILTLSFAGLTAATIATIGIVSAIKHKDSKLAHGIKLKNLDFDLKKLGFDSDAIQGAKDKGNEFYEKTINVATNASNIKDDFARRLLDKIKGTKIGSALTTWYQKMSKDGAAPDFKKAQGELAKAIKEFNEANPQAKVDFKLPDFDDMFKNIQETTTKNLTTGTTITQELFGKNANGERLPFKDVWKRLTSSIIANDRISDLHKTYLIHDLPDECLKDAKIKKALHGYNKVVNDIIEKSRDTNLGNAISDVAGVAASVAGLGIAVGTSDTKEEKKSITINLGIPLITTLATMMLGNLKNISGVTNIILGLATGQIASIGAKTLDNALTKKKENNDIANA